MATGKGSVQEIDSVQVDGLVALKVIKHCQEEGSSSELVSGFLVGLVVGTTLEVTNCFPLPKEDDGEGGNHYQYQVDILKKLRAINIDYHQVGWYQSTYLSSHVTKDFLVSHGGYQRAISESVVLIYDPLYTTRGNLHLRAFRLTPTVLDLIINEVDVFTPDTVQKSGLDHSKILIELPVTLKNSRLMSTLLSELDSRNTKSPKMDFLGLSASQLLMKNMQLLMTSVDSLQQDTYRLLGYEKTLAKQVQTKQQFIARRKEENARRATRGEPLLPMTDEAIEQDLNLKPVMQPCRKESLLTTQQVDMRCKQVTDIAGEAFVKLYLAEGLQPK